MKTIAFIPARGGSKGIPEKNIKEIAGKPLIVWSIEQALSSSRVDEVYVSTDCENIRDVAIKAGAKAPFLRPSNISGDTASTESALDHFCDWLLINGQVCENLLLIQATSPIRGKGRFDDAIYEFEMSGRDSLLSVVPSHRFFWSDRNAPKASYDFKNRPRRQDLDESSQKYMETGSFYITKFDSFQKYKNRLCGSIYLYITPEEEMYEIDSMTDFNVCEHLLSNLNVG